MSQRDEKQSPQPRKPASEQRPPLSRRRPTPTLTDENPLIFRGLD